MFGEEAEDAVSLEGDEAAISQEAVSDVDDGDQEEEAISVVEETYSVGADNEEDLQLEQNHGKDRDSLPFQIAKDLNPADDGQPASQEEEKVAAVSD